MDDGELIRAVQRGDRESLTILYRRHLKAVWRYLHAHLAWDRATTDDLVSETFLAAVRNIGTFDSRQGTVNE
jgi:DNA-directed RNA polymerase specialized sigma24 family protein